MGGCFTMCMAFLKHPRFIYVFIGYLSNYESYIYQKQTNTTFKVKNIKSDSSQYNLKLLDEYGISQKGTGSTKHKRPATFLPSLKKIRMFRCPKNWKVL